LRHRRQCVRRTYRRATQGGYSSESDARVSSHQVKMARNTTTRLFRSPVSQMPTSWMPPSAYSWLGPASKQVLRSHALGADTDYYSQLPVSPRPIRRGSHPIRPPFGPLTRPISCSSLLPHHRLTYKIDVLEVLGGRLLGRIHIQCGFGDAGECLPNQHAGQHDRTAGG
jgi:hypothetical protein